MRNKQAKFIALGGILAALAMVIMCLGGLIPLATYVCPVICAILLQILLQLTSKRIGWAWYATVAVLSLLFSPDKEAAAVFVFLGYYPLVKSWFDRLPLSWLFKLLFFTGMILLAYGSLIYILGMDAILAEFRELGAVFTGLTLLMGDGVLLVLDLLLKRIQNLFRRK